MIVPRRAQAASRDDVHASPESDGQLAFDPEHLRGSERRIRGKLDEKIDIARRAVVAAGDRAEDGRMDHSYRAQPSFALLQRDERMAQ